MNNRSYYIFWTFVIVLALLVAFWQGRKEVQKPFETHCALTGETAVTQYGKTIREYRCKAGNAGRAFWTE